MSAPMYWASCASVKDFLLPDTLAVERGFDISRKLRLISP